eukprot:586878-Amphidinium_carterae.1
MQTDPAVPTRFTNRCVGSLSAERNGINFIYLKLQPALGTLYTNLNQQISRLCNTVGGWAGAFALQKPSDSPPATWLPCLNQVVSSSRSTRGTTGD